MKLSALVREAWATTWAAKVASLLLCAVVAGMCFATIATVGRSAASSAEVSARLEQAGARTLRVVDLRSGGFINEPTTGLVQGVTSVESATALGSPIDTVNGATGAGGLRVPTWEISGDLASAVAIVQGRRPQPGEALVSLNMQEQLRLEYPTGFLTTPDGVRQFPIVGSYAARASLRRLDGGAVVAQSGDAPARELVVVIDDTRSVSATVQAVLSVLGPVEQADMGVESPAALARTARDLERDLAEQGRALLLMILGAGGLLIAAVVLSDVLVRRRDLGRRRTLGVTRANLVALVTGRCVYTATVGAAVGCTAAMMVNRAIGVGTPVVFAVGVAVLGVLVSTAAAMVPALYAARLDPVEVMRVP